MYRCHFWVAGFLGIPPVPFGEGSINFGDAKQNKRLSTIRIVDCPSLDPNKLFGQEAIVRRIAELELLAHELNVGTASALEATFQARMNASPTEPGYALHRPQLCYHLTQDA